MARDAEFRAKVTADDQASRVLDDIAEKGEELERLSPELPVSVDDRASGELDEIEAKARAVDGTSADVAIGADDRASGDLDQVEAKARAVDGTTVEVRAEGKGFDELLGSLDKLPGAAGDIAGSFGDMAGSAGAMGGSLLAAAGPAAAIGTALFAAAGSAADLAISAQTTADLMGSSVEDASRLQAVWKQSGADVNDLNDVMLQMNGVLQSTPEVAKQLGVNLNDGKDIAGRFVEVVDKIQRSTLSASDKAQLMASAFGEEGVRQVGKLTTLIGTDLQAALDKVSDTQVVTDQDVEDARAYEQNMAELKTTFAGLATTLGQAVLPAVVNLSEAINDLPVDKLAQVIDLATKATPMTGLSDLGDSLADIGASMEKAKLEEHVSSWERLNETMAGLAAPAKIAAAAQAELNEAEDIGAKVAKAAADAYEDAAEEVERRANAQADAVEEAAKALERQADALLETVDAMRTYADASLDAEDAQAALIEAIAESDRVQRDSEATTQDKAAAVRNERDALISAADANAKLAESNAEAAGKTFTATQKLDSFNDSLLANANYATPAARSAIADYIIKVNDVPAEKATEIRAAIDRGDLATADRLLDEVSRAREAAIIADASTAAAESALNNAARARTAYIKAVPVGGGLTAGLSGLSSLSTPSQGSVPVAVPTAAQIAAMIGPVRVPVDAYVRSTPRVTGVRA